MKNAIKRALSLMIALMLMLPGAALGEPSEDAMASEPVASAPAQTPAETVSDGAEAPSEEAVEGQADGEQAPPALDGEPESPDAAAEDGEADAAEDGEADAAEDGEADAAEDEEVLIVEAVDPVVAEASMELELLEAPEDEMPGAIGEFAGVFESVAPGADDWDNEALLDAYVQRMIDESLGKTMPMRLYSALYSAAIAWRASKRRSMTS